uniref:Uncharacterized protein n=1 Tax=Onchocerca volvulus TaxID=6282 RepID=A0A8R1TXT9_ONCVO
MDPIDCLYGSTIFIALWNIIYSILQIIIFAWQTKYVKNRQWEFENRQIPIDGTSEIFQARFPGLHGILTETPERRRINALFALAIASLIVSLIHLILSIMLFYGTITKRINFIWPWFFTALPLIILSTSYAIIWWTGDIFDSQLIMSIIEFILSLAINSVCFVIILLFFFRFKKSLKFNKPLKDVNYFKNSSDSKILSWKNDWNIEKSKEFTSQIRKKNEKNRNSCIMLSYSQRILASKENAGQLRLTADRLAEHNRILCNEDDNYWRCNYRTN